ncbi:MAG: hypothetical protein Hyperionvirus25_12 [Hyperionvirus sp.]|uniref:Chromosomal protein MC1 domain-containing protein n=1 Tax=Hyperionvirus sp. TaxID=2487770 RepID=A0A3G5AB17_9VIRU|nr:MAG: hypothetical protein Hyperionvirus25_12 [Hyperionvirus sp.]
MSATKQKSTEAKKSTETSTEVKAVVVEPTTATAVAAPEKAVKPKNKATKATTKAPKVTKPEKTEGKTEKPDGKTEAKAKTEKAPKTTKAAKGTKGAAKAPKAPKVKATEPKVAVELKPAPAAEVKLEGGAANPDADPSGLADADKNDDPKKRYFKCVYNDKTYGRLCGLKPKQAANKAFTSLLKHMKKSGQVYAGGKINFSIVECTRGSKHNTYCYIGERKPLQSPVDVHIKVKNKEGEAVEKKVTYFHKNHVKKVRKADME